MDKFSPGNFSWSNGKKRSRLDLALASPSIVARIRNACYRPDPSSDHKIIELVFRCDEFRHNFKIPRWLLNDEDFNVKLRRNLEISYKDSLSAFQALNIMTKTILVTSSWVKAKRKNKSAEHQRQIENILEKKSLFVRSFMADT
ncbi:Hypothetical protein FKW44_014082, partial [Caligus rogercresseyi]